MSVETLTLKHVVEALIFASEKPMSAREVGAALRGAAEVAKEDPVVAQFVKAKEQEITEALEALAADYRDSGRPIEVRETASGWQLVTSPSFGPWLRQLFPESKPARLSAPALETLAIIAYRQPITRADIEAVRGVAVDGVMQTLLDRNLVRIAGRAEIPGRPLLYETTHFFMEHFGLRNLDELPDAAELRRAAIAASQESAANESTAPAEDATTASLGFAAAEDGKGASEPVADAPPDDSLPTHSPSDAEEQPKHE